MISVRIVCTFLSYLLLLMLTVNLCDRMITHSELPNFGRELFRENEKFRKYSIYICVSGFLPMELVGCVEYVESFGLLKLVF